VDLVALEQAFAAGVEAFLLCNPHNPTGTVWSRAELLAVAVLADRYGCWWTRSIHRWCTRVWCTPLPQPGCTRRQAGLRLRLRLEGRAFVFVSASKAWNLAGLGGTHDRRPGHGRRAGVDPGDAALRGRAVRGARRRGGATRGRAVARGPARRTGPQPPAPRRTPRQGTPRGGVPPPRGDLPRLAGLPRARARRRSGRRLPGARSGRRQLRAAVRRTGQGIRVRLNFATHPDLLAEAVHRMSVSRR
jgi:hypothetical protein